mgnify:CR=1 FL=1
MDASENHAKLLRYTVVLPSGTIAVIHGQHSVGREPGSVGITAAVEGQLSAGDLACLSRLLAQSWDGEPDAIACVESANDRDD